MVGELEAGNDKKDAAAVASPTSTSLSPLRRTSRVRKEPYKYRMALAELAPAAIQQSPKSAAGRGAGGRHQAASDSAEATVAAAAAAAAAESAIRAMKSGPACVAPVSSDSLVQSGVRYAIGDVVQLKDKQSQGVAYYALLRGLLQDQYLTGYCVLTWLLPTTAAPPDGSFDPAAYLPGPDEDAPRPLDSVRFVCSRSAIAGRLACRIRAQEIIGGPSAKYCRGFVQSIGYSSSDATDSTAWTVAKFPRSPSDRIRFAADQAAAVTAQQQQRAKQPAAYKREPLIEQAATAGRK
uniref:BAH domain-containing protein n=1 Tax=Macrostomum lignano TaxID=282301 RepID=A0A1I8HF37_9PLAT